MDFIKFYMSENRNECPLQVSYLIIYFICDVNVTSLCFTPSLMQRVILVHYKIIQYDISFSCSHFHYVI